MSLSSTIAPAAARNSRVVTFGSIAGAAVVTALIGGQLLTVTATFVYSLVVLFHIPPDVGSGLGVAFGALALWGAAVVARLAFEAETDPANN